jgi:hypothetical protein
MQGDVIWSNRDLALDGRHIDLFSNGVLCVDGKPFMRQAIAGESPDRNFYVERRRVGLGGAQRRSGQFRMLRPNSFRPWRNCGPGT